MILNLANPSKSTLRYKVSNFPDGHKHIDIENYSDLCSSNSILIKTRITSLDDVFILAQAVEQIKNVRPSLSITLYISYLLAARYDRPMREFDSFDLKLITDYIKSMNFQNVVVVEPHSNVTTTLLNKATVISPLDAYVRAQIADKYFNASSGHNVCFIAPDLGAVKRLERLIQNRDVNIVYCNKHRVNGEVVGIKVMNPQDLRPNAIIFDDLCDGGRTFIEVSKAVRQVKNADRLNGIGLSIYGTGIVEHVTLAVTHGIFSKGIDVLFEGEGHINELITTNSFKEISESPDVKVIEVI